jgi:hypothetical protein
MRTIQYGGQLLPGDFIAVSDGNHLNFGWYCGDGRGTLQYYYLHAPQSCYNNYQTFLADPEKHRYYQKYEKGFTLKNIWKSYINAVHRTRVMKINNPEEIFTDKEDIENYQKSKEVLITLNFINK